MQYEDEQFELAKYLLPQTWMICDNENSDQECQETSFQTQPRCK